MTSLTRAGRLRRTRAGGHGHVAPGSARLASLAVRSAGLCRLASLAALLSPARLNIMWFMDWMEPAAGFSSMIFAILVTMVGLDPFLSLALAVLVGPMLGAINGLMADVLEGHLLESFGHADCSITDIKTNPDHERIHDTIDEAVTLIRSYLK